jgi:signal transduction histidine kinase
MLSLFMKGRVSALVTSTRVVPVAVVIGGFLAATMVFLVYVRGAAQLRDSVREENRLRMRSTQEHVEDYFDAVYSALLFVSLDEYVKGMRKDSADLIQRLYDHQSEVHHLAEIYIVERDFPGTRFPFQKFELASEKLAVDKIHTVAREVEEYQAQMAQIRQFLANTNLTAVISPEIQLCVNDQQGKRARGMIYSVPINSQTGLVGIVAGMIPNYILHGILQRDQSHQAALLINGRGEVYDGQPAHERISSWLKDQLAGADPSAFFDRHPLSFSVNGWVALWTSVDVVQGDKWWLVYMYDPGVYLKGSVFAGALGHAALAGALALAGVALALVSHTTAKRSEDQVRYLREREQLERQVQAASERAQRRIGEVLHEDLCQRLAGIAATGKFLEKRLKRTAPSESDLAVEIAGELHESLGLARQLAGELQPVSLLDQGFRAAVETLVERTQRHSGIACRVEGNNFPHLQNTEFSTHLYRITQEALANAVKHAQAKSIVVALSSAPSHLTVSIADDGVGMPDNAAQGGGLGLRLMRYRSDLIDAVLEVKSTPGNGTTVTCRCFVPKPELRA